MSIAGAALAKVVDDEVDTRLRTQELQVGFLRQRGISRDTEEDDFLVVGLGLSIEAAERGIAIDQLHEPCWRLALEAEAALGLRDAVVARYERLAVLLDDRLGVRPEAATTAVYREALG